MLRRFHALLRVGITQVCKNTQAINVGFVHFIVCVMHFPPLKLKQQPPDSKARRV